MSLAAAAHAICRCYVSLTDAQAHTWAAKVDAQVSIDPWGRGPRYWAIFLGLAGDNLDRVLLEPGQPPAPRGRVPVMRVRRAFYVKRLFPALVLLLALVACIIPRPKPPTPPTPAPVPTLTPPPVTAPLLLRQPNPPHLERDGQPFLPYGAIQCCMPFQAASLMPRRPAPVRLRGVPCNTLWPLASECWMDYAGANLYHFRMGPFYGDAQHEIDWAEYGGPYAGGPGSDWNPAFWDKYGELLAYARSHGANVEVNVIDTWYCKHAQWGDQEMPWPAADIEACGRRSSPEQEKYIRKVVSEAKYFQNVIWITDNEGGEIQGTTRDWYEWVHSIIRDEERKSGGAVRLIGTNNTDFCDGPFDYCATHDNAPLTAPIAGKHTENNERNGQPQSSPEQEHSRFCQARANGLHYWFWRAEMTDAQMAETIRLFRGGCGEVVGCFPPGENDPLWQTPPAGPAGSAMRSAVDAAKAAVGEHCGTDHAGSLATLDLLGAELRTQGHCAGRLADSVSILAPDGKWEEFHAVTFASGCWSQDPAQLPKHRWTYLGQNPTPAPACGSPTPPTVSRFNVKEHTKGPNRTVIDSTPIVGPDAAYCAAIGFTDGRALCPVRVEGAADRVACEALSVGAPVWSGPGQQSAENPYQYIVAPRGVTGTATVCASAAPAVCGQVEVTP